MANTFLRTYLVNGEQRIAEWSADASEAFCAAPPDEQGNGSNLVINPDSLNCNPHWPDPEGRPCIAGYRTPPECQHEPNRLDPNTSAGELRCLECGLTGRDVTADWRDRLRGFTPSAPADPDVIALGTPPTAVDPA